MRIKGLGLFIAFCAVIVLAFMVIGFSNSVTAPANNTTAGMQYENLSKVTSIADAGIQGYILLLILAIVLSGAYMVYNSFTRRR